MTLSMLSQNTDTTKEQKKRIKQVFTPEKIIDISKGLSNEQRQSVQIDSLQKIIDAKDKIISDLKAEHLKTLTEIAKSNKVVKETTSEVDSISDHQLKKERFRWKGLHLYGGVEIPDFNFESTQINSELMYELEKVEFGFKAAFQQLEPESGLKFATFIKLRYKFF